MNACRSNLTFALFLMLGMTLAGASEDARASTILLERSQADFMSSGGTEVVGCGGTACPTGVFSIGNVSGTTQAQVVSQVFFQNTASPTTAFHYSVFNDGLTQSVTTFQVADHGVLGIGTAPAGWTFSQNSQFWTWTATNASAGIGPKTNGGIGVTQGLTGFNVVTAGQTPVTFDDTIKLGVTNGTSFSTTNFVGPGPNTGPGTAGPNTGPGTVGGGGGGAAVPEPISLVLFGSGLVGLRLLGRRVSIAW